MDSEHPVPAGLQHLVQSISLATGTAGDPVTVAPDTATGLVFCEHGGAAVTGPRTRAGYYDQAHLTVEFRTIMGVPPATFVSGRLPLATPCAVIPQNGHHERHRS